MVGLNKFSQPNRDQFRIQIRFRDLARRAMSDGYFRGRPKRSLLFGMCMSSHVVRHLQRFFLFPAFVLASEDSCCMLFLGHYLVVISLFTAASPWKGNCNTAIWSTKLMSTSLFRVSLTTKRDPKWICHYCMVKCTNECKKLSVSQQQSRSHIPWATLKIGMELQNVGCFVTRAQGMRTGDASSLRGQWDVLLNSEYPTVSPRAMAAGGSASAMAGASSKPREVNLEK